MSILSKLYRGELTSGCEETPESKEYEIAMAALLETEEKLRKTMTSDQKELFEAYKQASSEVGDLEAEDCFKKGCSLAVRLVKEVLEVDLEVSDGKE